MVLNGNRRKIIYLLLAIFIFADLGFSFLQHYNQTLDGDMEGGIIPAEDVKPVLSSPLGLRAAFNNETYPNPNRFFSHWIFNRYFNSMPFFLQHFTHPVESVYLSAAIFKTALQLFLLFLLTAAVSGTLNILRLRWIVSAAILTPLLQTNGYRHSMGIIDNSTTYTFFYALPSAFLILFLLPLALKYIYKKEVSFNLIFTLMWILLLFVVCLSGPLNSPALLIIIILFLASMILSVLKRDHFPNTFSGIRNSFSKIPPGLKLVFISAGILSLWALFLSRYNSVDIANQIPVWISYSRLPAGILDLFLNNLGYPLLTVIVMINAFFIAIYGKNEKGNKIITIYKWVGLFILFYVLLLPLGGYRFYRPNVIRFDSIMPVTLSLFLLYGISTVFLLKIFTGFKGIAYLVLIALIMFSFTLADKADFEKNDCEKAALYHIADSKEDIVKLDFDCNVVSWQRIERPQDSEFKAELLKLWRITETKKLFYYNNPTENMDQD